ncbi:hypothetical protein HDA32_003698 [Spinactinospora alkalitolerans]|uniref:Uncharacterized protein n=1 Tax=Spinactinospora alkalitolerans TaxID=687207 RepID=A0A852TXA7_9ACTN|nr:hypothetical protein [Spinactinospora alkalitolerans]NYE48578.1 hypothetical protein [Spinactinospora alkalitolerans]
MAYQRRSRVEHQIALARALSRAATIELPDRRTAFCSLLHPVLRERLRLDAAPGAFAHDLVQVAEQYRGIGALGTSLAVLDRLEDGSRAMRAIWAAAAPLLGADAPEAEGPGTRTPDTGAAEAGGPP